MDKPGDLIRDRKKWGWLGVCLGICLWAGCRQEVETPAPLENGMFLTYKSGDTYGEGGASVHYVAFAGKTASNKEWKSNGSQNGLSGKVPLQGEGMLNDVYMVINPDETLAQELAAVHDKSSLEAVRVLGAKLPENVSTSAGQRYYNFENLYVQPNGIVTYGKNGAAVNQIDPIQGKFLMAKVKVVFDIASEADMIVTGTKYVIQSVRLKNLPAYSYLLPKVFDGTETAEKNFSSLTPATPGATSYKAETEVLVPEYLRGTSPEAKKVILVVTAQRWKDGKNVGTSEYELPVGNAMASGAVNPDDYNIDRNKVYTFSFTRIGGEGTAVDDWRVDKKVSDWEVRDVPTDVTEADGLFLETTLINEFRSFRLPRYVTFKATGKGGVTVDYAIDEHGNTVAQNDFDMEVLWDDATHKSGKLSLKRGNWRTDGVNFDVWIKLRANNIEKVLRVNTVPPKFAEQGISAESYTWMQAMNYTDDMLYCWSRAMTDERLILEYSRAKGTGCAAYYEGREDDPLTGKGCWRVSTIREGLRYMYDHSIQSAFVWAYEMGDTREYQSYTSRVPPAIGSNFNWHHPPDANFSAGSRSQKFRILCVLDDRLEKYYNVGVNAKDHSGDVSYAEARAICAGLTEGGYTDWRLPTAQESGYALLNAGTQGIPNNFDAGLYWLEGGVAAGVDNPGGTPTPPGGVANVRCVRTKWEVSAN